MPSDKRISIFRPIIIFVLLFVVGALALNRLTSKPVNEDAKVALAQCLTDKGTKMYGTYWCPHCTNQKKAFGAAFEKVTYVECAERGNPNESTQVCKDANIQSFPTWVFADGSRVTGEQSFESLADRSGCPWTE